MDAPLLVARAWYALGCVVAIGLGATAPDPSTAATWVTVAVATGAAATLVLSRGERTSAVVSVSVVVGGLGLAHPLVTAIPPLLYFGEGNWMVVMAPTAILVTTVWAAVIMWNRSSRAWDDRRVRPVRHTEEPQMGSTLVTLARAIIAVIGAVAFLLAAGNLLTGGGSISDPVMPGGIALGLVAIGAAFWTTAPGRFQAVVVWLGVLGIVATAALFWANAGDMQTRDLLVYIGIPTAIVLAAAAVVAVARARSGPLGAT